MYFALKGKRSQLDTSDRKGTYLYANHFYKPVWEKRRLQTHSIDAGKGETVVPPLDLTHDTHCDSSEAEGSLVTAFNTGFPVEVRPLSVANHISETRLTAMACTVAAGYLRLLAVPRPGLRRPRMQGGTTSPPHFSSTSTASNGLWRDTTVELDIAGSVSLARAVRGQVVSGR